MSTNTVKKSASTKRLQVSAAPDTTTHSTPRVLSRDSFRPRLREITLKSLDDGIVYIRDMSMAESMKLRDEADGLQVTYKMIAASVCDRDGTPIFVDSSGALDPVAVADMPIEVFNELAPHVLPESLRDKSAEPEPETLKKSES